MIEIGKVINSTPGTIQVLLNSIESYKCKVKFKTREEYWTKDLRDAAYRHFLSL